mgnify:CR=1 FL=1
MATDPEINLKINVESTFAKGFEVETKKTLRWWFNLFYDFY